MAQLIVVNSTSVLAALVVVYGAALAFYRLNLHPLAEFPGPTLSIISYWYEFYFEIERLHDISGPIIRINPDELHIKDADFFNILYSSSGGEQRNKYARHQNANESPGSVASTGPADLHRLKQSALNPFFSKASITRLEPLIQEKVELLCNGLRNLMERKEIVYVGAAYYSLSLDVISDYSFGTSWHCLDTPGFATEWEKTIISVLESTPLSKQLPWINLLIQRLPAAWRKRLTPDIGVLIATKQKIGKQISHIKNSLALVDSLPPLEKELRRVIDEAFVLLISGTDTTVHALAIATYHLLANPSILFTLKEELKVAIPDPSSPPSWRELEQLPYLRAVISETLRIGAVATIRIATQAPSTPTNYKDWIIPAGTPVAMNTRSILHDRQIFPEPEKFQPERLDKYLVAFSKGSRACLGLNLAYAEMYLALANVMRRFEMVLDDVVRERDVDIVRDCIIGLPSKGSKGVTVRILREN
ncbi:cytochrome P450 [Hyaloscypha bicolor E]|uniref:Cytochrome P450 n=1 Tax=Hyaloscypha bicolor E TaxID=1095630 RepID=A0A2J6SH46_9HELO|nr:cytochrome P450 [Hyaloscypha bicolor E]PMD50091.1 cytochrome P450 [Hyaloscypha bicolor E]